MMKVSGKRGCSVMGNASLEYIDNAVNGRNVIDKDTFRYIHDNLSRMEKFVYLSVPIEQPWRLAQIIQEVRRSTTVSYAQSLLEGTLEKLVASGLVLETSKDVFVREIIFPVKPEEVQLTHENIAMKKEETETHVNLAKIFDDLYESACQITAGVEKFKVDINKAAVEVNKQFLVSEEKSKQFEENSKKLIQLQALLKGVTG